MRTCIVCRQKAARDQLLRLVVGPHNAVAFDRSRTMPGRGAWVHPKKDCLESVSKDQGRLSRAFRIARVSGIADLDLGDLEEQVKQMSTEQKAGWKLMGTR